MGRTYVATGAVLVTSAVAAALIGTGFGDAGVRAAQDCPTGNPSFNPVEGLPLHDPPAFTSRNHVLKVNLDVRAAPFQVSGISVAGKSYNGQFVGPTLRVRPGDRMDVTLHNNLAEATNLHFHGMHVSPMAPADDVLHIHVMPGETYHYSVRIPGNHDPGTFWYHSHAHGQAEEQVFTGLSGTIVVEGDEARLPKPFQNLPQRVLALKDLQVANGAIVDNNIDSNQLTTRTVNGLAKPRFLMRSGQPELWRLANIGADIWYRIDLRGLDARTVNEDGNPVTLPRPRPSELILPPGKRYDVVVRAPQPGRWDLRTLKYSTGPVGDCYPEALLATADVRPGPYGARLPARLVMRGPRPARVPRRAGIDHTFRFTEDSNGLYINGKKFDPTRPPDVTVPLNTTQNWLLINQTQEQHPFHIHIDDFTVLSINGQPYHATSQQDTVPLPVGGRVVVNIPFDDFAGEFVFHCHILAHEDAGMMATVLVKAPPRRAR